jgi:hypothetical protein
MVSTQVSQEQVDGTVILSDRGFAECRCQRFRRTLERLRQRMLERSSSASHILRSQRGSDVLCHGPCVLLIHVL